MLGEAILFHDKQRVSYSKIFGAWPQKYGPVKAARALVQYLLGTGLVNIH